MGLTGTPGYFVSTPDNTGNIQISGQETNYIGQNINNYGSGFAYGDFRYTITDKNINSSKRKTNINLEFDIQKNLTKITNLANIANELAKYTNNSSKILEKSSKGLSYVSTTFDIYNWLQDPIIENYQNVIIDISGFMHPFAGIVMYGYFESVNNYMNKQTIKIYGEDNLF